MWRVPGRVFIGTDDVGVACVEDPPHWGAWRPGWDGCGCTCMPWSLVPRRPAGLCWPERPFQHGPCLSALRLLGGRAPGTQTGLAVELRLKSISRPCLEPGLLPWVGRSDTGTGPPWGASGPPTPPRRSTQWWSGSTFVF